MPYFSSCVRTMVYRRRVVEHFTAITQGGCGREYSKLQSLVAASPPTATPALQQKLGCLFARFGVKTPLPNTSFPDTGTKALAVQEQEVRLVLRAVNLRKAVGPYGVSVKLLIACAYELLLSSQISSICLWRMPSSHPA